MIISTGGSAVFNLSSVSSLQSISVGLIRCDYMVDERDDSLKQTEINTFAVGSFGITDCLPGVHRCVEQVKLFVVHTDTAFLQW